MLGFQVLGFSHFGIPGDWDVRFPSSEVSRVEAPAALWPPDSRESVAGIWGLSPGMAFGGILSSQQPYNCLLRDPPYSISPRVRPQQVLSPKVKQIHVGKKGMETHRLPCLPPQDLHHLGHQQLVPPRAGPSGPGRPRRSPTRRQPQPVPQRHFNGNHWLGGQTRERRRGRCGGVAWAAGTDATPGHCQVCERVKD